MLKPKLIISALCALLMLSACATNMRDDVVTSGASAGKVVYGTVVSYRAVTIKDSKELGGNAAGGLTGGVAGGVAASAIGSGTGSTLATVGGVVAGAILGAMVEDMLSTDEGREYVIKLDAPKNPNLVTERKERNVTVSGGANSIQDEVSASAIPSETEADAISVIQQDDAPIAVGTRVMVIYRDDGTRVVPAF